MTKHLYLMRHGQTLFNKRRMVQGWSDSPLTELGINQALIAKDYFTRNNIVLESAYTSTSERASDTLELVTDLPYERIKGLKEWNFGLFEGESEDLNPSLPYRDFFVKYGGEEEKEFQSRIVHTATNLMENDKNSTVLMVAHGALLGQFYIYWEEHSEVKRDGHIRNCAILHYLYEDGKFILQEVINHDFSSLDHLV